MSGSLIGALRVSLGLESAQFEEGVKRARGTAQRGGRDIGNAFGDIGKMTEGVIGVVGRMAVQFAVVAGAAKLAFNSTREMQRYMAQLEVATGSAEAAGGAFKDLSRFAAETPFTLSQVTEAYIKLKNLGIEPTEDRLRSFGNTSAAMGKDLMQYIEAVADAANGQNERLFEFGIKASKEGDKVKFTFQGVSESVENNAEAITAYLQRIGETKFGDAMAKQAATIDGKLSNLQDATAGLGRALGGLGISSATTSSIEFMTQLIKDATKATEGLGKLLSTAGRGALNLVDRAAGVDAPKAKPESVGSIAERRRREEEIFKQLPRGSAIRALREAEYRRKYGISQDMALEEEAMITVTASKKVKEEPKAPKSPKAAKPASDFVNPADQEGWALQALIDRGTAADVDINNQALQGVAATLADLKGQDFSLEIIRPEAFLQAERFAESLSASLGQALVFGQSLGKALVNSIKAAAAELITSGLLDLLLGGKGAGGARSGGIIAAILGVPGFAGGTNYAPGGLAMVGERGRELVNLPRGSQVIPNGPTEAMLRGGQPAPVQQVQVTVAPSPLFITSVVQGSQAAAGDTMRRANRQRMPASVAA